MKIAFCFLTINNIENDLFYYNFFKNAYNYNIYINSKNNNNHSLFKDYVLNPSFLTKNKADISIVYATHYLLSKAYENKDNTIFIFLCGSNIPLINYDFLYKLIIKLDKPIIKSFNFNKKERYFNLNTNIKNLINYHDFTKQHPNMILTRDSVKLLLDNTHYIPFFKNISCCDEHYFINLFKLLKYKYYDHQIMFCNTNLNNTQALTFNNVNINFINKLKNNGFLFLRKVNNKNNYNKKIINIIYND